MTEERAIFALQGPGVARRRCAGLAMSARSSRSSYFNFCPATSRRHHLPDRPPRLHRRSRIRDHHPRASSARSLAGTLASMRGQPDSSPPTCFASRPALFCSATNSDCRFRPAKAGLGKFYRSGDLPAAGNHAYIVSRRCRHLQLPWQPSRDLTRPVELGEIVVTSACREHAAGGILGSRLCARRHAKWARACTIRRASFATSGARRCRSTIRPSAVRGALALIASASVATSQS